MWIPKDEGEIISATTSGSLEETITFDAKREIPSKNVETAKDVSALANSAGGVLLYGVAEDSSGRPTVLSPLILAGQRERIDQVVRTSVDEVPHFAITTIPIQSDPSKGYLVVVVPPSERAPHMVVVNGEQRFYGRGETGNYVLSQSDLARLYERRRQAGSTILPVLEKTLEEAPIPDNDQFAHVHIVARPVLADDNTLTRACLGQAHRELLDALVRSVLSPNVYNDQYSPDFQTPSSWTRRPEGYLGKLQDPGGSETRPDAHTLHLQVNLDGSAWLFCGRAAEPLGREGRKEFFSSIVAGNIARFLALLGNLYESFLLWNGGYGHCFDGPEWICAAPTTQSPLRSPPEWKDYRRSNRSSAASLSESPKQIASELLMPLIEAISQGSHDPFKES